MLENILIYNIYNLLKPGVSNMLLFHGSGATNLVVFLLRYVVITLDHYNVRWALKISAGIGHAHRSEC